MSSRRALRRAGRVSPRAGSRRGRRALVLAAAGGPAPEPEHIFDTLGATWWIDAAEETTGGATSACQWALNRGSTSVPHARLGSTGRAELRGSYGLVLPGVSGNYASAPDSAPLSITGDLEIIAKVNLVDWTPDAKNVIVCKGDASAQDSYVFRVSATTGVLDLTVCNAAGTYIGAVSSAAPTVVDGADLWVRATVDIDNGANSVFKFYTSSDGSSWTQLGTTQTATRITTSVRDGTSTLNIGCYANGVQHLAGSIYRVIIKDGYDGAGTTVFDADFTANTNQSSFTESSANAATVTINRATSGRKAVMVTRPVWLFGTDDYMEVADNAMLDMGASQDFALVTVGRQHATWANSDRQISKRNNAGGLGYVLANTSTSGQFETYIQHGGGSGSDFQTGATLGTLYLAASVRSGSDVTTYIGTTGSGTTVSSADLSNSVAMRVGADPDSANYLDGEIVAVAVFRSALSSSDLADIASYFGV